ncbi:unnamed protein product [Aspergillus oryzae RIB40]|uniref:DNA, SC005 n=1 Tax=Aspergillus oryzae (strain ATCC 42149 / RIB 40) TaxID=510516 RepID=Q2UQR5_ASPOR|nr:unnamed protein product [Aspergillus oryzae RIB40]BAE56100.1 unnamed protein product [Aspergillus oryzae RIB40]
MQSAEPMSQTLEELQEKTDMVEYPQTLKYIRGALTKSKLRNFIQQLPLIGFARPAPSTSDKWAPTEHDGSFYDTFKKLLEQSNQASDADAPAELPKMNDLTKRLGLQFEKVFGQIALTQRRGLHLPFTQIVTKISLILSCATRYHAPDKRRREIVLTITLGCWRTKIIHSFETYTYV